MIGSSENVKGINKSEQMSFQMMRERNCYSMASYVWGVISID
jgi:hypothetical protein